MNSNEVWVDVKTIAEINKKTGDIIYIDNRPVVQRDSRQKEDIKIILRKTLN